MSEAKILMIDDDLEDQWTIREAFESLGRFDAASYAVNGEQAMNQLNENHNDRGYTPNLIVLDLNMPIMNGILTLQKLKEDSRFRNIPVIIYSTSVNPFEHEKCMQLGAHSYITKPFTIEESIATAQIFLSFCA